MAVCSLEIMFLSSSHRTLGHSLPPAALCAERWLCFLKLAEITATASFWNHYLMVSSPEI